MKVALGLASFDHQKSKLRAVAGAEGFWVAELWVWQLKIGRKSCFANLTNFIVCFFKYLELDHICLDDQIILNWFKLD